MTRYVRSSTRGMGSDPPRGPSTGVGPPPDRHGGRIRHGEERPPLGPTPGHTGVIGGVRAPRPVPTRGHAGADPWAEGPGPRLVERVQTPEGRPLRPAPAPHLSGVLFAIAGPPRRRQDHFPQSQARPERTPLQGEVVGPDKDPWTCTVGAGPCPESDRHTEVNPGTTVCRQGLRASLPHPRRLWDRYRTSLDSGVTPSSIPVSTPPRPRRPRPP